jgi:hypothetical protein
MRLEEGRKGMYADTILDLLDIMHRPVLSLKQCFGDWILSPPSGKSLLSWAKSI